MVVLELLTDKLLSVRDLTWEAQEQEQWHLYTGAVKRQSLHSVAYVVLIIIQKVSVRHENWLHYTYKNDNDFNKSGLKGAQKKNCKKPTEVSNRKDVVVYTFSIMSLVRGVSGVYRMCPISMGLRKAQAIAPPVVFTMSRYMFIQNGAAQEQKREKKVLENNLKFSFITMLWLDIKKKI